LAWGCYRERSEKNILVSFDARMEEIYWGAFQIENDQLTLVSEERVVSPTNVPSVANEGNWFGAGTGWKYAEQIVGANPAVSRYEPNLFPHARYIAELAEREYYAGRVVDAEHALPVYLRDSVAWKKLPGRE
ncbi:MAG TPA: tRNA threonylcarbamoyladenosine biosynthesis protein TsaB, partial [Pseudomonadales bacterium]|nr:tRNA threonylcarbamoyladenosine biosynthesis protein TsaB [Pseudomonadales bacterium]